MNILEIMQKFPTQEACLEHLERVRWGSQPRCVYCESDNVGRHPSGDRKMARWQCFACKKAFSVTVGTIFHGTHMPLRDWFLVLSLMLSAKKSASAYQISRDLGIRRPTVWSMMHRARAAMKTEEGELLHGVVEMDETYVGGKPRKTRTKKTIEKGDGFGGGPNGTLKMPVIGVVERNGRVVAAPADNAQHTSLLAFFRKHVDPEASILLTDEYAGYKSMHK